MFKLIIMSALTVACISACTVAPARGTRVVISDDVKIETNGHGNGNFCPPGQAKKGNC